MHAFSLCTSLKEVIIPNSVSRIGNNAFYGCSNLKTVYIPDSVKQINDSAFSRIKGGAKIYCETQKVADILVASNEYYSQQGISIVVAPEMFS